MKYSINRVVLMLSLQLRILDMTQLPILILYQNHLESFLKMRESQTFILGIIKQNFLEISASLEPVHGTVFGGDYYSGMKCLQFALEPYPVTSLHCDPGQLIGPLYTSIFPLVKWNNNTYWRIINEWKTHKHIEPHKIQVIY